MVNFAILYVEYYRNQRINLDMIFTRCCEED